MAHAKYYDFSNELWEKKRGGITTVTKLEGDIPLGLPAMLALVITMKMTEREKP